MRRILVLCMCALALPAACFAQANQTESLTITTYYPVPYGVFKNLQLKSSPIPSGSTGPGKQSWSGTLWLNNSDSAPYVHNGTDWVKIGSGGSGSSGVKFYSGKSISPDHCSGTNSTAAYNRDQLCSGLWYENITFSPKFTKEVHVIVMLEQVPDYINSSCAGNVTDRYIAYPKNISVGGFQIFTGGSPLYYSAGEHDTLPKVTCYVYGDSTTYYYGDWNTRAIVSWFAVGE